MAKLQKKKCSHCGEEKPKSEYHKNSRRRDGLETRCKQCTASYVVSRARGLEAWPQVGDSLRVMAEMQAAIDEENESRNRRIALINEYSDEINDPFEIIIKTQQCMIESFLAKDSRKTMKSFKEFRYGKVKLSRGRLDVVLYKKLAKKMKGKP